MHEPRNETERNLKVAYWVVSRGSEAENDLGHFQMHQESSLWLKTPGWSFETSMCHTWMNTRLIWTDFLLSDRQTMIMFINTELAVLGLH